MKGKEGKRKMLNEESVEIRKIYAR